jgi:hypothetical protein
MRIGDRWIRTSGHRGDGVDYELWEFDGNLLVCLELLSHTAWTLGETRTGDSITHETGRYVGNFAKKDSFIDLYDKLNDTNITTGGN